MKQITFKKKKEDGNYINFALSGMLMVALLVILYIFEFRVQANSLENYISTGVQMAEDSILSASSPSTLHAKEQDRYHIIINSSVNNSSDYIGEQAKTQTENIQVEYLAKYYLKQIKDTFYLDNNSRATAGELYNLQGKAAPLKVTNLTFYEAIYRDEVGYNKLKTHNYDNIKYFVRYDITIDSNNNYVNYKKYLVRKNDAKIDGKLIEGSTVDSKIQTTIYINTLFHDKDKFGININKDVQMGIVSAAHDSRKQ